MRAKALKELEEHPDLYKRKQASNILFKIMGLNQPSFSFLTTAEVQEIISKNKTIEGTVCAAIVINRYKNSEDGQIFVTCDFYGKITEKDYSKYSFNGSEYNKRELIKVVVNNVLLNSPEISYEELAKIFSDKMLVRAIKKIEEIPEKSKKNYFDDVITLKDGVKIKVCNQWGTDFDKVLQALQKIYPDIYKI